MGNRVQIQGFWAHGNLLRALPDNFGNLNKLHTISLAGNRLGSLPKSISGLVNLKDLGLQGNELTEAPAELGALSKLNPHSTTSYHRLSPTAIYMLNSLQHVVTSLYVYMYIYIYICLTDY